MRPYPLRRAEGGIAGVSPGNRYPRKPTRDPQAGILGKLLAGATAPVESLYDISQGDVAPLGVEWVDGLGWVQRTEKAIPFATEMAGLATTGALAAPAMKNATGMGIRAYHGSPHDFDRFSMDKIGTGEGAQAYGHGLYFAENEGVARSYRDALTNKAIPQGAHINKVAFNIVRNAPDLPDADLAPYIRNVYPDATDAEVSAALKSARDSLQPGRVYEVDINASPDEFLDWDKPLSEQPAKVREAVKASYGDIRPVRLKDGSYSVTRVRPDGSGDTVWDVKAATADEALAQFDDWLAAASGRDVYQQVARGLDVTPGSEQGAATGNFRSAGIKGIRYKDAGSRGLDAEGGTSNYVVFDDNIIDILKKYGIAGLTAGGAGAAMLGGTQDASAAQPKYVTGGRFAAGGKTTPMNNGIASAAKQPHDVFRPGEERQLAHGLIKSPVPGRTDQLPLTVPKDSYIIPADVISGLGQGNTDAGWPLFRKILAARGVNVPEDGVADDGPGIDIIAAGGEGVVHPSVIASLGGGDVRKGHKILDDIVLAVRKQTAKRLSSLPGPKK